MHGCARWRPVHPGFSSPLSHGGLREVFGSLVDVTTLDLSPFFFRSVFASSSGGTVAGPLLRGRRPSTLHQHERAWSALGCWLDSLYSQELRPSGACFPGLPPDVPVPYGVLLVYHVRLAPSCVGFFTSGSAASFDGFPSGVLRLSDPRLMAASISWTRGIPPTE